MDVVQSIRYVLRTATEYYYFSQKFKSLQNWQYAVKMHEVHSIEVMREKVKALENDIQVSLTDMDVSVSSIWMFPVIFVQCHALASCGKYILMVQKGKAS